MIWRYESNYEKAKPWTCNIEEWQRTEYKSEELLLALLRYYSTNGLWNLTFHTENGIYVHNPAQDELHDPLFSNNENVWFHPHKIRLKQISEGSEGLVFYFSDFLSSIRQGSIVLKLVLSENVQEYVLVPRNILNLTINCLLRDTQNGHSTRQEIVDDLRSQCLSMDDLLLSIASLVEL